MENRKRKAQYFDILWEKLKTVLTHKTSQQELYLFLMGQPVISAVEQIGSIACKNPSDLLDKYVGYIVRTQLEMRMRLETYDNETEAKAYYFSYLWKQITEDAKAIDPPLEKEMENFLFEEPVTDVTSLGTWAYHEPSGYDEELIALLLRARFTELVKGVAQDIPKRGEITNSKRTPNDFLNTTFKDLHASAELQLAFKEYGCDTPEEATMLGKEALQRVFWGNNILSEIMSLFSDHCLSWPEGEREEAEE